MLQDFHLQTMQSQLASTALSKAAKLLDYKLTQAVRFVTSFISMSDIEFHNIRPQRGKRHEGFEELTVQLFRSDFPHGVEITRVDGIGGDGGVEAFAVLSNGQEVGVQAKYFDRLGPSQWRQLTKSITSALKSHPNLTEYRVSIPLDRSPSQKRKWDSLVKGWLALIGRQRGRRKVKFIWWGASELRDMLTNGANQPKLLYWFGCHQFSSEWMNEQIDVTVADLDCRYTPKHHIRTSSEELMDAFSLTERFVSSYYQRVKSLFDACRKWSELAGTEKVTKSAPKECAAFADAMHKNHDGFGNGKDIPLWDRSRKSLIALKVANEGLNLKLKELNRPKEPFASPGKRASYERPFDWALESLRRVESELENLLHFLDHFVSADCRQALIVGEAGSGKSHLLAATVLQARRNGQPALFVLGEHFLGSSAPWPQLLGKLGWDGSTSELLAALNQSAEAAGRPALLAIDALNESSDRALWRSHLNSFARKVAQFPNVRLIVSCRSDFTQITLPDPVANGSDASWTIIEHTGYGDELFDAVASYFSGYGIHADHFPPLLEEFRNPLFLKTFCEAFENSRLPADSITLDVVMKRRVSKTCEKLLKDIDCPVLTTRRAIELIAEGIQQNRGRGISKEIFRPRIDALFHPAESRSLYRHLKSNGILVEVGVGRAAINSEEQVAIRFPYERFSDYFIADRMLRAFTSAEKLRKEWKRDGTLKRLNDGSHFWTNRGLMQALAILIPERFGIEYVELLDNPTLLFEIYQDFLTSLPWRSAASFGAGSHKVFCKAQQVGSQKFLQALLKVSSIPNHPYNANYLHSRLARMKLAQRDTVWTMEISRMTIHGLDIPDLLLKWVFHVPQHLVSNEQALLVGRVLMWFFSTNHKGFRLRSTLAAIRLLEGRSELAGKLVREFHDCNDPYIVERVFAVACGVAMREQKTNALQHLAEAVFETVFALTTVPAHILLRDYARCVLELAHSRGCLPSEINPVKFRPRYRSKWPSIWSEEKVKPLEASDGWDEIRYSVKPECTGMYGDFGRYVMQSHVHQFSGVPLGKRFVNEERTNRFDAMTARRWVVQRVKQLGWTPELFGRYESSLPWKGRQRVDIEENRVERISKKYQWIALHELQGYLSDHYYRILDWGEKEPTPFAGTWELWARDFDPSQPLRDSTDEDTNSLEIPSQQNSRPWWYTYPTPIPEGHFTKNREKWVVAKPECFKSLIEISKPPGLEGDYLALAGYYNWKEQLPYYVSEREAGHLKMWTHLKTWLVKRKHLKAFIESTRRRDFYGFGCRLPTLGNGWFGEYPWGQSHQSLKLWCEKPDAWLDNETIPHIQGVCHNEGAAWAIIPSPQLCDILNVRWSGKDFEFVDENGSVVAFSPFSGRDAGTPPCIVARDKLVERLKKSEWAIVWGILGQRTCFSSEFGKTIVPKTGDFSGVFYLEDGRLTGGITHHVIQSIPRKI